MKDHKVRYSALPRTVSCADEYDWFEVKHPSEWSAEDTIMYDGDDVHDEFGSQEPGDMPDFTDNLKPQYDGPAAIQRERDQSPIIVQELAGHLLSSTYLERQTRILALLEKDAVFSKQNQLNLSRPDRFKLGLSRTKRIRQLAHKHNWDLEDHKMAEYLVDEMSPYHLHYGMFSTAVKQQGSDEQIEEWMSDIDRWKILGSYAQTELGHGSNVRGIETMATYDLEKQEWVLHSPTLTASKWWPGALGRIATHAVVIAQLRIPKKNGEYDIHGPHQFLCRIRDQKTHQPLEGIVIGDIGPKYGYTTMDNGYMLFNKFRLPHSALLCRYSKVDKSSGAFTRHGHQAIVYSALTATRGAIIMHARLILARAVTIAIRYTSIRRQFQDKNGTGSCSEEMSVLDYPTVQIRLLPLLATTFALHYTGQAVYKMFEESNERIKNGDFSSLAEMHGVSSGLKSVCTQYAADGIEICRRSMGGHGFGGASGLIGINADYLSKPTVEGDNWMITQQAANYLIKKMDEVVHKRDSRSNDQVVKLFRKYMGKTPPSINMVKISSLDNDAILEAFEWRTVQLTHQAYEANLKTKDRNSLLIQFHTLAKAYSELLLITNFSNALSSAITQLSQPLPHILTSLFHLYALHTISLSPLSFPLSQSSLTALPSLILQLMTSIRPHAVKLVDAWSMPDYLLDSALGRYDGRVYEDLFHRAHRLNPLNSITFNPHWENDEIVHGSGQGWKSNPAAKL